MTDEPSRPSSSTDPPGGAGSADPVTTGYDAPRPDSEAEGAADTTTTDSTGETNDGSLAHEPVSGDQADQTKTDGLRVTDTESDARNADDTAVAAGRTSSGRRTALGAAGRFLREIVIIVVVALVASALLRAFVVQAFFVPSGSMLPTIQLHDRILVSRIGDIERGEVVVFEDPGNWIPTAEQAPPPSGIRKALEFVGVLPASGHEHLVKRVIGLPGDRVICCKNGMLTINGVEVDESSFIKPGNKRADNVDFDVLVPADSIFVLGDNRYVSGDSSRHPNGQEAFIPMDLVTGRAFAVIWPRDSIQVLHIPSAYDDVPDGETPPPEVGTFSQPTQGSN